MVTAYYRLVVAKRRTCKEGDASVPMVPKKEREAVIKMLYAHGYDVDGTKLV